MLAIVGFRTFLLYVFSERFWIAKKCGKSSTLDDGCTVGVMHIIYLNPKRKAKEWREHYAGLRLEARIADVRRRAIWGNRDPDLAERQYRAAVERNQMNPPNKQKKKG